MDCCPLPELLGEIIDWCFPWNEPESPSRILLQCTRSQLETVRRYLSELEEVDSNFNLRMHKKLRDNEDWQERFGWFKSNVPERVNQLVLSFLQDLGELFKVPTLPQPSRTDNTLTQNQLIAGFINFLLQLLHPHPFCAAFFKFPVWENIVTELRFLAAILGDTPFQATEHKQVQSILGEFELVANETATSLHSIIFGTDLVFEAMNEALGTLLENFKLLKPSIIEFSDIMPNVVVTRTLNVSVNAAISVGSLLHDLEDLMNQDDNPLVEVNDLIKMLHQQLILCRSLLKVLQHIEAKELHREPMGQVIAAAYDAEYLIHLFLVGDVPLWYLTIRLSHHITNIEHNATRLQEMKLDYDVEALKVADDFSARQSLRAKKDSLADDIIVGFEEVEKKILDQLICGTKRLQQIFIFGMPGVGKTTLAKELYSHPSVSFHFDKSLWCVVSQIYQRKKLLIDILICIRSELKADVMKDWDEEKLKLEIYQSLIDRRYLIVMDDIWDSKVWDDLKRYFPDDANGSRILFTGREKDVAPPSSIINELTLLSTDHCWELLEKKVFHNNPCPPQLREIGKNIAKNCYGLPLFVVVIAGILLSVDKEEGAWENVRQSLDSFMLSDQSISMMQILELSYNHLPLYLKPCFLYFGVFKEDAEIPVRKLTQLWIAEGLIHREEENRRIESVAEEYLTELIDKSLVIVSKRRSDGGAKFCIVHDLLHDMCLRIAQKENFLTWEYHDCSIWNQRYHGLCVQMKLLNGSSPHCLAHYGHCIRAVFFPFAKLPFCVRNMKLLRVLDSWDFSNYPWENSQQLEIDVLVHLRYLSVKQAPTLLHSFVNLEFLLVNSNLYISSEILKMVKLKYICCRSATFDGDCNISQTSKLEILFTINIYNPKDVEMLKCLPLLRMLKCHQCDQPEEEQEPLTCLDLQFLTRLESLSVCWVPYVEEIKLPSNIRKLTLGEMCLPWVRIEIIGALPYLEVLKLESSELLGEIWETSDGQFTKLRILKMKDLVLVEWNVSSCEHFPMLQQLSLYNCSELIEIPFEIGEIETLQLIEVRQCCRKSLVESAIRIREEQEEFGNDLLRVDLREIWNSDE